MNRILLLAVLLGALSSPRAVRAAPPQECPSPTGELLQLLPRLALVDGIGLLAFAASCSNGYWSNCFGYRPKVCCGTSAALSRDTTYLGSIPAADGGTPTQVTLRVGTTGTARVTFTRDGVEVVESYDTL